MNLQVAEVTAFLKAKHVPVIDEWTVECLDWLKQEYQGQNVTSDKMKQNVYDQWLTSDLTDIAAPSLPKSVQEQKKTLSGNYALQINSLLDVSIPAYGQLVKLQGKENENVLVGATQQTQQTQSKFEPKSSRMLMLQLTDGHQSMEGMEYQPIPALSVDTPPGTKILVSGTVQCRRGVLLLTAQNVQVLGGDVEALQQQKCQLQILSNVLGVDGSQVSQQEPAQTASNRREPVIQDTIDLTIDTNSSDDNVNSNGLRNRGTDQVIPSSDDFGDGLDALMLNEIQQIEEMDRIQQMASNADKETEWPVDDDIDEMWLEQVEQNLNVHGPGHLGRNIPTASHSSAVSSISNRQDVKKETNTAHHKATTAAYSSTTNRINPGQTSNACMSKKVSLSSTDRVADSKQWNEQPRSALQKDPTRSRNVYNPNLQTVSGKPAPATGIAARITKEPSSKDTSDPSILSTTSSSDTPNSTSCLEASGANAFEGSGSNVFESASSAKRSRFHSSEGVVTMETVMSRIQAQESFAFNIKGFVVTLLSPLSRKDGYWSILAKISDKTASMDVELSNQVLTQLIGFSVPEMTQMKKSLKSMEATEAKDLETKLRQGLAQCQKSLIDMHCLMTIKVRLDEQRPLVTMVGTTSPEDIATKFREVPKQ